MKKKYRFPLLTLLWIGVIWGRSMQPASSSAAESSAALGWLASLLDGSFRRGCFCIELTDDSANPLLRIRPAGSCTRTVCSCSYAALADRYAELLRFLRSQGFSPCGDGMDRELAGPYGEEGNYLLEITIPVHSRA